MAIEHPNYINIDSFDNSSLSDIKFSSLPASDIILIHEDDNLAVDADQNFLVGIKLT